MAIAVVQDDFGLDTLQTATTIEQAFGSNVTAGNTLIVAVGLDAASGNGTASNYITGVTDSLGNTYSRTETNETIVPTSSNRDHLSIWVCENCTGGACTVTVTCDRNVKGIIGIIEASGLATSSSLDKIMTSTSASATAITTGLSGTLSQADELVVGVFDHWGSTVSITPDQTAVGENEDSTQVTGAVSWQIVSATTSVANTWTLGSAAPYGGHGATFKAAAPPTNPDILFLRR